MLHKIAGIIFSVILLLCTGGVSAQDIHIRIAGRDVAIWRPAGAVPPSGYPIILFSHGYTGCSTQSVFLMRALAEAGYLVLAPNHQDAGCGKGREQSSVRHSGTFIPASARPALQEHFREQQAWTDADYKDRASDLKAVLNSVLHNKSFQGIAVDGQRVGLAGHSLGGYTVLGLAGAWRGWKDRRIKAVLAMSPVCSPYLAQGDLGRMNVPVMYQGGTYDWSMTPNVRRTNGAYDLSSAPKYYVEFAGAGHFAWTNAIKTYHELINEYALAFFNRHLKGDSNPDPLDTLTRDPLPQGVSAIRFQMK